ncbi:Uncharacterised protein [Legionella wadsworthii]|uniref:Uncharacterized protein n=1 Tax=Legionella wadsworthii TaxID=28088 RepID=A0A378LSY0_9GAMM|nr:hypothetical protein [Legionella wadsworthii]STY29893.1 Uncharacterised protein [Legionella wadsworthii]
MNSGMEKDLYQATIRIENNVISTVTGKDINFLKIHLSEKCDLEQSGVEGEITELSSGKIVYKCHKQTIIDQ